MCGTNCLMCSSTNAEIFSGQTRKNTEIQTAMTSSPTLDKCHAHPVHTVTGPFPYQRSVATKGQSPTMTSQNVHVQRPQNHRATRGWHHGNVTVKPTVISKWTTWSTLAPIATKTSSQKEVISNIRPRTIWANGGNATLVTNTSYDV